MVLGRQWIRWNPAAKKWFGLPPRPERSCTSNQLIGRVAHMVARMLSNRPTFSVLAQSDAPDARRAAIIGEKVLEYDWTDLKLFQHRYFSTLHMIIFGFGLIKYWYDPHWGAVRKKKRERIMPDGLRQTEETRSWEYAGGIRAVSTNPAELLTPPGLYWPDLSESPWVAHQVLMTPEEVSLRYGVEVNPEENPTSGFSESLAADVDRFTYYHYAGDYKRVGRVKVTEYYEKPSPRSGYENGVCITACQGKVLSTEPSQFSDGRYPFAMFVGMPEPGKFTPHAWVSDLNGPQVQYNQMLSRMDTWAALAFYPNIINPTDIPDHHFRSGGFAILNTSGMNGEPKWMVPPQIPGQAFMMADNAIKDLDRIGSQYGFGRGEPQTGAPSGALAQVMIEADSTELGPLITLHARAWEELGVGLLELHRKYDPPEKLIVLTGSSGAEIMQYKKTDIPVGLRCVVQEDSLQPRIKAARKQELMSMLQSGIYGNPAELPPKTRIKLAEWAGHPTATIFKDADLLEYDLIESENLRMVEMGMECEIAPTDDHEAHISGHRERTLLKDRFEWGPVQESPVWQRIMAHIQGHQQAIDAAKQQQMAEQQQQMQQQVDAQMQISKGKADLDLRNDLANLGGEAIIKTHDQPEPGDELPKPQSQTEQAPQPQQGA